MRFFLFLLVIYFFSSLSFEVTAQSQSYARSILDTLCGPEMEGRGHVNEGELKAAGFIAGEFDRLGLKSFGENYFQHFNISVNTLPGELTFEVNKQPLKPGEDFLIDADAPSATGTYPVIPLPREIIEDQIRFSMSLLQIPESIVLIDEAEFDLKNPTDLQLLNEVLAFLKCYDHPQIMARAIILMTEGDLTWSPAPVQCLRPLFRVKKIRLPLKLKRAGFTIESKFYEQHPSQNVIGYIEGASQPDSILLVSAHYDHLGKLGSEVYFPGANDNASGIAMLLNLAAYYQEPENQPEKTIVFIAFGAEELGLRGSYHFTENPLFPINRINFLVNLDILGTGDDGIQVVNGTFFQKEFDLLTKLNTNKNLLKEVKIRGEMCKSDHCFFHEKGVPNFYIYTLGGVAHYHDIYDHPDTLPLTEFEDLLRLLIDFMEALSVPSVK